MKTTRPQKDCCEKGGRTLLPTLLPASPRIQGSLKLFYMVSTPSSSPVRVITYLLTRTLRNQTNKNLHLAFIYLFICVIIVQIEELGRVLCNICNVVPGGVVCFFPSYDYEKLVISAWEKSGVLAKIQLRKKVLTPVILRFCIFAPISNKMDIILISMQIQPFLLFSQSVFLLSGLLLLLFFFD